MAEKTCPHGTPATSFCKACERGDPPPQSVTAADIAAPAAPTPSRALSRAEARQLTDRIKSSADALWKSLVDAHDRGAHAALGFSSWADYCEAEFGLSRNAGYRLLTAGRVAEVVAQSPNGDSESPIGRLENEAQARELAPLLDEPEQLRGAFEEALADGKPTAEKIRNAVAKRAPTRKPREAVVLDRPEQLTLEFEVDDDVRCWRAAAEDAGMELDEWIAALANAAIAELNRD